MGNPVPHPMADLFCPWDNPNFPPGETPRFAGLTLSGICVDPDMPDLADTLINGSYNLEQVSPTLWQCVRGDIVVRLSMTATRTTVNGFRGWIQFSSYVDTPNVRNLANQKTLEFGESYYLGSAHWAFWTDIADLANSLAVGNSGKTFSERLGTNDRLAERAAGSCVYARKVGYVWDF